MSNSLRKLVVAAVAVIGLAAVDLTGIAIVNGFKDTNLIDNDTADDFVTGLTIFASFLSVIVLALVGKAIIGLFKAGKGDVF
jgi:hypothetical protein